ncbi:NAD(P)/FAD-dependent oxidoreductase [Parahaliea mediterranea]|uniref:NAD(P)/FAD-dependent oxidoreductase n=1 Tax=Parahaliea mediterranea TaxID=651086 RepID=UPI000E2FAF15|nr:NAD(P)/FAD-dependent oxidoreductase [Parahaliea mediterranea]
MPAEYNTDVIIIGAGPSGAVAGALLARQGHRVCILEREQFPRFSIGESLLPQCMEYLEQAGMLEAVQAAGFQRKNGARFQWQGRYSGFDFSEQFTAGYGETFEVQRARFDHILAQEAERQGVEVRYRHEIRAVDLSGERARVQCCNAAGEDLTFSGRFLLDASGFGRVLPRLLALETPSGFPVRSSLFTHIEDGISDSHFDRNKILITVHPRHRDVWYWLIPFSDGRSSIGVVAEPDFLAGLAAADHTEALTRVVHQDPELSRLLAQASWDTPARCITGYSANVSTLHGDKFALLGNAGEFLDPVFSSGVTIALRSASMAAAVLDRQLRGEAVDWEREFAQPLSRGVATFRTFVEAWYAGRFQDVVFFEGGSDEIRRMICSILAGYAWDRDNPFVERPAKRLQSLWRFIQRQPAAPVP